MDPKRDLPFEANKPKRDSGKKGANLHLQQNAPGKQPVTRKHFFPTRFPRFPLLTILFFPGCDKSIFRKE